MWLQAPGPGILGYVVGQYNCLHFATPEVGKLRPDALLVCTVQIPKEPLCTVVSHDPLFAPARQELCTPITHLTGSSLITLHPRISRTG